MGLIGLRDDAALARWLLTRRPWRAQCSSAIREATANSRTLASWAAAWRSSIDSQAR